MLGTDYSADIILSIEMLGFFFISARVITCSVRKCLVHKDYMFACSL